MSDKWTIKIASGNIGGSLVREAQTPAAAPAAGTAGQQAPEIPGEAVQSLQGLNGLLKELNDLITKLSGALQKQPTLTNMAIPPLFKAIGYARDWSAVNDMINKGTQMATGIAAVAKNPTALTAENAKVVVSEVVAQWEVFDSHFQGFTRWFGGGGSLEGGVGLKPVKDGLEKLHEALMGPMRDLKKAIGK